MSEKENNKPAEQEKKIHPKKRQERYGGADKNQPELLNKAETGVRQSRGKKQRRQFKLAPNRG